MPEYLQITPKASRTEFADSYFLRLAEDLDPMVDTDVRGDVVDAHGQVVQMGVTIPREDIKKVCRAIPLESANASSIALHPV